MGFNGEVIDSLGRAFAEGHGSGKRFFSKDSVAYIDRGRIIVTPIPDDESCESLVTPRTERIPCGGGTLWFEHADVDDIDELRQPPTVALLDEAKLSYPLKVRRWSEGDAFVPFGMGGRRKKVSDMLIDDKVSLPDKRRQFVVVSGGDIVWLVGRRIDERYAVGSGTENVLRIRILPTTICRAVRAPVRAAGGGTACRPGYFRCRRFPSIRTVHPFVCLGAFMCRYGLGRDLSSWNICLFRAPEPFFRGECLEKLGERSRVCR